MMMMVEVMKSTQQPHINTGYRFYSQSHRQVVSVVSMETQAVPTGPALLVLGHALGVRILSQEPISWSGGGGRCGGNA